MLKIVLHKNLDFADGKGQLEVDCLIKKGQFIALTGPSGSGKTTLLRCLAGLATANAGQIVFEDKIWFDAQNKVHLPPQMRQIGYVFQEYALFPNMTVEENLRFALPRNEAKSEIAELVAIMELDALLKKSPNKISGGQQQRVALARALARKPKLLLLDEPLSALDVDLRHRLQDYLLKVHQAYDLTTIMISHDRNEILKLADVVFEMHRGQVVRSGLPKQMYLNAIDEKGILKGIVIAKNDEADSSLSIRIGDNLITVNAPESKCQSIKIGAVVGVCFINNTPQLVV